MVAPNPSNKKFIKYLLPTYIWAVLIFFVSSIPGNKIPPLFSCQNIVFHILEYAILGWLINRAIINYYPNSNNLSYICLTILMSFIYALLDEFHQSFVPYRGATAVDVFFDTVGAIIGSLFLLLGLAKRIRLKANQYP